MQLPLYTPSKTCSITPIGSPESHLHDAANTISLFTCETVDQPRDQHPPPNTHARLRCMTRPITHEELRDALHGIVEDESDTPLITPCATPSGSNASPLVSRRTSAELPRVVEETTVVKGSQLV
jgi:hypothetical protein